MQLGEWEKGLEVYEGIRSSKLRPTVSTYNALMTALCKLKIVALLPNFNAYFISLNFFVCVFVFCFVSFCFILFAEVSFTYIAETLLSYARVSSILVIDQLALPTSGLVS